jgi:hypothetical protein
MLSVIKLLSGPELIGTISNVDDEEITVNNPLQIMYIERSSGVPAITLQRYMPFTQQQDLVFSIQHVETIGAPIEGLTQYYDKALKVIKEHIDPSLVTDLMDASEERKEKYNQDQYLAVLERFMSKKPLN